MERYDSEEMLLEKELELILDNADDDDDDDENQEEDDELNEFNSNKSKEKFSNSEFSNLKEKVNLDEAKLLDQNQKSNNSINGLVEKQYQENYNLSKVQYEWIKEYFEDNLIDGTYISIYKLWDDVCQHFSELTSSFKANRNDLIKCLKLIDEDNDGLIDFNDLIEFMSLCFLSKHNFKKKIFGLLNARKFSHQTTGYLSQNEAYDFLTFLKRFYVRSGQDEVEDDDHIYFYKEVSYKNFVSRIAFYFKDKLFIEW